MCKLDQYFIPVVFLAILQVLSTIFSVMYSMTARMYLLMPDKNAFKIHNFQPETRHS